MSISEKLRYSLPEFDSYFAPSLASLLFSNSMFAWALVIIFLRQMIFSFFFVID